MKTTLAQWLQWPLYNPKRLLGTLGGLVILVLLVSAVTDSTAGHHTHRASTAARPTTTSTLSPSPSTPSTGSITAASATARAFVAAWASHPSAAQRNAWIAAVTAYATPQFADELASIDPSTVPASKVTGTPRRTDTGSAQQTSFGVPTDQGLVSVTLVAQGSGWLVSDVEPGAQAVE